MERKEEPREREQRRRRPRPQWRDIELRENVEIPISAQLAIIIAIVTARYVDRMIFEDFFYDEEIPISLSLIGGLIYSVIFNYRNAAGLPKTVFDFLSNLISEFTRETKIDPSQYGEEDICPICRTPFNQVDEEVGTSLLTIIGCKHKYHKKCILKFFEQLYRTGQSLFCPMCRTVVVDPDSPKRNNKRRGSPTRKSACHSKKSQNCKKSPRCTWTKGYKNVVSGKPVKGLCRRKKSPGRK